MFYAPFVMVSLLKFKRKTDRPPGHEHGLNEPSLDPSYNLLHNTFTQHFVFLQ
jgi:hypothetical protein